jgi:hypothetical protein
VLAAEPNSIEFGSPGNMYLVLLRSVFRETLQSLLEEADPKWVRVDAMIQRSHVI